MKYYEELAQFEREGFDVIVDKTWEDIDPWDQLSECFDSKKQLYADIDSGKYDWFMLRVRVQAEGVELGTSYLGGCLYEDAREVLTDGTAEELIYEAIKEAKSNVYRVYKKFAELNEMVDRAGVVAV